MSTVTEIPAGMTEYKRRELPDGGLIEFEFAPAMSLTAAGEMRYRDWRAYFFTAGPDCEPCNGSGRMPSEKRPGGTIKCAACNGSGDGKRERMISVTTLLNAIVPKGGLPVWAEARGIEGVIAAMRLGEIDANTTPERAIEIVRELKLGADRARDAAADRGLNVHALLEAYMRTGEIGPRPENPNHWGFFRGLCDWLLKTNPEPEAIEDLVCDPAARYAGRRDLVARVAGLRMGFDAKTQDNAGIYSGAHLQLKMYDRAAVAIGEEPCDFLTVVVFAADGSCDEMACEATDLTVDAALTYYREMKPIESLCTSRNAREKKARQ